MKEARLIRHNSYLGRFGHTLRHNYDYTNPLEAGAAGVKTVAHGFGLDDGIRDLARWFDGNKRPIPELTGMMAETREMVSGTISDLAHLRIPSAVANVMGVVGNVVGDTADLLAGVSQRKHPVRSETDYSIAA